MSIAMPLYNKITIESSKQVRARTLEARYGDGQGQWAANGLNSKVQFWDIIWGPLSIAERNIIEAALDSVGGYGTILWTPCTEVTQRKWRVVGGEYSSVPLGGGNYKISCKLEERFT